MTRPRRERDRKMIGECVLAERRPRTDLSYNRALHRLREIDALIGDRYGQIIPETVLPSFLEVAALCHPDTTATQAWVHRFAPYASPLFTEVFEPVRRAIEGRRYNLNMVDAGALLRLTFDERQRLKIRTMWAADLPIDEQQSAVREAKNKRDRDRLNAKREGKHKPRNEWLAEHNQRPWEAEGIKKRAWYYRQNRQIAQVCRATHKPIAQVCRAASAQVCRGPENTVGVLQGVSDKRVQAPSIEPADEDLSPMTENDLSVMEAGPSRPAVLKQLDLFENEDSDG